MKRRRIIIKKNKIKRVFICKRGSVPPESDLPGFNRKSLIENDLLSMIYLKKKKRERESDKDRDRVRSKEKIRKKSTLLEYEVKMYVEIFNSHVLMHNYFVIFVSMTQEPRENPSHGVP